MRNKTVQTLFILLLAALTAACSAAQPAVSSAPAAEAEKPAATAPAAQPADPTAPAAPTTAPTVEPTPTFYPTPEIPVIVAQEADGASMMPAYGIHLIMPHIEGDSPTAAAFNKAVDEIINGETSAFEKAAAEADKNPNKPKELSSLMDINHNVVYTSLQVISVRIDVSAYLAGAAHPENRVHTLNFDLATARPLALADLFNPGADYLTPLAATCEAELMKREFVRDDPNAVKEGSAPKPENYDHWNITACGLEIIFDTYQVAPYVAGQQSVVIPYSELKAIANPQGVLGALVK